MEAVVGGSSAPGTAGSASSLGCGVNSNTCVVPPEAANDVSGLAVATTSVAATVSIGRIWTDVSVGTSTVGSTALWVTITSWEVGSTSSELILVGPDSDEAC